MIPDCTLTTCCFCVHDKNKHAFSVEKIKENILELMKSPVYLVIYCDESMYSILHEIRQPLDHLTRYVKTELRDLWTYQYEDQVNKNREIFWPTRDARAGTDSHLITCNKFDFVLQTMDKNPFNTTRFGWIDCFLNKNAKKIAEDYTPNMIPNILSTITDKFHIQVLNVNDKKYKQPENKREYYNTYRYVVCGCLFTCGKEIGKKILERGKEIFVESTKTGVGHGEEMLYLELLDEFDKDIHRSYGDYGQILNNFNRPSRNFHYLYYFILNRYFKFGYHKECYDCGNALLTEIKEHRVSVSPHLHFQIAFELFISTYYFKREEAKAASQYIMECCRMYPPLQLEWDKNPDFYKAQLSFVL
jgi:hypothetical protein